MAKKKVNRKTVKKSSIKSKTNTKTKAKTKSKNKKNWKFEHHPDHYNTSEEYLVQNLEEDLKEAWFKIRQLGASLGTDQRIYASGRAIMFSKKVCYFFVRPQKKYLEVVIFLKDEKSKEYFKAIRPVSKVKYSHTFRLVHPDQVEGELVQALEQAYSEAPSTES